MGSQGIKRRKRRPRPPSGGAGADQRGNWELHHSPFEGQLEGLSRFGRGFASASPQMRLAAKVVALVFIVPFLLGLLYWRTVSGRPPGGV